MPCAARVVAALNAPRCAGGLLLGSAQVRLAAGELALGTAACTASREWLCSVQSSAPGYPD